jgi:transposase-like protein
MPAPHPPEFRARAVELARERAKPIAVLAKDLGISESCLRNWMVQADVDQGVREGLMTPERDELVRLRRENRVLRTEKEILGKAAAFFATENGHRPS